MSNLAVGISIGAVLSASFENAVAGAPKKLAKIGDALAAVKNKNSKLKIFEKAERDLEAARSKMARVGQELARINTAMQSVKGRELTALKREAKKLGSEHLKLGNQVDMARRKVVQSSMAHHQAKKAAAEHTASLGKLGTSFEKMHTQQSRMQTRLAAQEAAQAKFGVARAKLFMPIAIATGLGAAIKGAGQFQSTLTDIAITADLPREKIAQIGRTLGEMASQTGQTRAELAQGFNVLVTAGMDEAAASKVIKTVGLTATAAGAEIGDVAQAMYSTVSNLKLDPSESLKAMDMLVQAGKAGSFELKDMSKYFPSMTAAAGKLGMTGTKAVATLGASMQVAMDGAGDPSQAATNMENFLNKLTSPDTVRRFEQQGVNLEARFIRWQERGLDPIEESMKLIQKMTDGDSFRIGELFSNKGVVSFITPMIAGLEKYRKIRAEVSAAEGLVSADARRRMKEDPAYAFKMMGDSLIQLRDAAIAPLLEPMGSLFASIINGLAPLTGWMTANKELIGRLGKTFATLLGGKLAFSGVVFGIAAVRRAWTALGIFMMGSPLLIAIKLLAMGALVIWSNWDKIGPFFTKLWGGISSGGAACWRVIQSACRRALDGMTDAWRGRDAIFKNVWQRIKTAFEGGIFELSKLLLEFSPIGLIYKGIRSGIKELADVLPKEFSNLGKQVVGGLIEGLSGMGDSLKNSVLGLGDQTIGWFKDKLGIKSPSRVFMGLGGMVGQGAALGIGSMTREAGHAAAKLGAAVTLAFAPNLASSLTPASLPAAAAVIVQADILSANRPAAAGASTAPSSPMQQHIVFNITQQAGESGQALARRVADLLRRQSRQTRHGALGDWA